MLFLCIPRYFLVFLSATVSAADLFVVLQELLHVCVDVSTTQHHLGAKALLIIPGHGSCLLNQEKTHITYRKRLWLGAWA